MPLPRVQYQTQIVASSSVSQPFVALHTMRLRHEVVHEFTIVMKELPTIARDRGSLVGCHPIPRCLFESPEATHIVDKSGARGTSSDRFLFQRTGMPVPTLRASAHECSFESPGESSDAFVAPIAESSFGNGATRSPLSTISQLPAPTTDPTTETTSSLVETTLLYLRFLNWGAFPIKWLCSKTINLIIGYWHHHAKNALYHTIAAISILVSLYIALTGAYQACMDMGYKAACSLPGASFALQCSPHLGRQAAISVSDIQQPAIPPDFDLTAKCKALGDGAPRTNEEVLSHLFSTSVANHLASNISMWNPKSHEFDQSAGLLRDSSLDIDLAVIGTKRLLTEVDRVLEIAEETYLHWWDNIHNASSGNTLMGWLCYAVGLIDDHLHFCQVEYLPHGIYNEMNRSLSSVRSAIQGIITTAIDEKEHIEKMHDCLQRVWQLSSEEERITSASMDAAWPWTPGRSRRLLVQAEHRRAVRIHLSMAICATEIVLDTLRQTIAALEGFERSSAEISSQALIHVKISLAAFGTRLRSTSASMAIWHYLLGQENAHAA
ncbi:hypothetical protein AURDEDRAFT_132024 [Auricularia subglabra TFB-10046 SS5]|uniref:Uncharacterized protein n=1 Tax=Auricularia subglabra (strain TFB-10046 / SS5) TaxID=717982 RepID=J0WK92_AURST|nr:hypothetical protein AURDEDRAFT_132024 [Auricularia subglabra TFB-10046 SS5]